MELINVTKSYRGKVVLSGINLKANMGEIVGVVGPNGAGKTTILKILGGFIQPSAGEIIDRPGSTDIGATFESQNFISNLSCKENISLISKYLHPKNDADYQLFFYKKLGIHTFADILYRKTSLGMKKRLSLYATLLTRKKLYVFDEPTNGLDTSGVSDFKEIIKSIKTGASVFIASHHLEELEDVCDRIIFLANGEILADLSLPQIVHKYKNISMAYQSIQQAKAQ